MKKYLDKTLEAKERARLLLEEMSLDEKMAQINCIFPFDQNAYNFDLMKEQTKYGIGEVSTLEMRRMETLDEVANWQRKVQKIVMENSEHHIPAIFHMEAYVEHLSRIPQAFQQESEEEPALIRNWRNRLRKL